IAQDLFIRAGGLIDVEATIRLRGRRHRLQLVQELTDIRWRGVLHIRPERLLHHPLELAQLHPPLLPEKRAPTARPARTLLRFARTASGSSGRSNAEARQPTSEIVV